MTCRQCRGIEGYFDLREANRDLKRYHKKGPDRTTWMLLEVIKAAGVEGKSLLDIGGGVGVVHHELLKVGASRAVVVEASEAFVEVAATEAQQQGYADRVTYHHGDFVDMAAEVEPADVVTLDRVICCYPDVEKMVGLSSQRAAMLYALVYPRDNWLVRRAFNLLNFIFWLRRREFRVFVHSSSVVDSEVGRNKLRQIYCRKALVWQVVVYSR